MATSSSMQTIEGQQTLVVERDAPLPRRLDVLIGALFSVSVRADITPTGASTACEQWRTHRFAAIRQGRHLGSDRVLRELRIDMCSDCGAVCVHDISFDLVNGLPVGGRGPSRRDLILGWYSGARRGQRQYQ